MESSGLPNKIQVSQFTADRLKKAGYKLKQRGFVKVKVGNKWPRITTLSDSFILFEIVSLFKWNTQPVYDGKFVVG